MPIINIGGAVVRVSPLNFDEFFQTAVLRSDQFALCDRFDRLKQLQFDVSPQTNQTILTLRSGPITSNTVITLPSSSGTVVTNSFVLIQPDLGTSPTANTSAATLILTSSDSSVSITGNSSTNTVDFKSASSGGSGAIVETGSWSSPSLITTTISVPGSQRAKIYIKGNGVPVSALIGSGSGTQELYLVTTDSTNTITLTNYLSNVMLSGTWYGKQGSMICLHWTQGLNKWVEAHRNEI